MTAFVLLVFKPMMVGHYHFCAVLAPIVQPTLTYGRPLPWLPCLTCFPHICCLLSYPPCFFSHTWRLVSRTCLFSVTPAHATCCCRFLWKSGWSRCVYKYGLYFCLQNYQFCCFHYQYQRFPFVCRLSDSRFVRVALSSTFITELQCSIVSINLVVTIFYPC